jgi:hypothetical protein
MLVGVFACPRIERLKTGLGPIQQICELLPAGMDAAPDQLSRRRALLIVPAIFERQSTRLCPWSWGGRAFEALVPILAASLLNDESRRLLAGKRGIIRDHSAIGI